MTKQRILFIDDEPNVLDAYRRSLRGECQDWLMEFASCAFEAWHRIQTEPFDAIVTDVRMPGLTGLQLLQKVKENPGTS